MKKFEITHFFSRSPDPTGWIELVYVRRGAGTSEPYFVGREPLHFRKIQIIATDTSLCRLAKPIEVDDDAKIGLWLSPENEVWLGDSENPLDENKERFLIGPNGIAWDFEWKHHPEIWKVEASPEK